MKLLLLTVHFVFVSPVFAQAMLSDMSLVTTEKSLCPDGSQVKSASSTSVRAFELSADLESLTITIEKGDDSISESFSLTAYGKDTYMAISNSDDSKTREFFVKTDEALSDLQIYFKDDGGALCGGGLIVTQISEFTLTTDIIESKGG